MLPVAAAVTRTADDDAERPAAIAEPAADDAALAGTGTWSGTVGGQRRQHRVEAGLRQRPADHQRPDRVGAGEQQPGRARRAGRAADDPRRAGGRTGSVVRSDSAPASGFATIDDERADAR